MSKRSDPLPETAAGPVRTCVGCRRRRSQDLLVRVVATSDGRLAVGRAQPGRGAWLCEASPACSASALRHRALDRALRRTLDPAAVAGFTGAQGSGTRPP